jgi:2-keto-3-deoxy-L-rhamnonate aldolase
MAGISGHSTKQVLEYAEDAYQAGANYTLCLPAAYFGKATTNSVIESFFHDVASGSKLPLVIYNFPTVVNGIDLDSEMITRLAKNNPSIVGVKLTCYSVGKIVRLAATFKPEEFAVYGGQSDFIIGGLSVGSAGCIAGFANVFPKTIVEIYNLHQQGKVAEALELHRVAALAESPCKAGIAATKYAASLYTAPAAGIENPGEKLRPRKPYEEASEATKKGVRDAMVFIEKKEVVF